jgi:hypothetical protein
LSLEENDYFDIEEVEEKKTVDTIDTDDEDNDRSAFAGYQFEDYESEAN